MKKILIPISVVIIILTFVFLNFEKQNDSDEDHYFKEDRYELNYEIITATNNKISVLLPILVSYNGEIPDVLYNDLITIYGEPDYHLENSIHGTLINITTNGSCKIGIVTKNPDLGLMANIEKGFDFNARTDNYGFYYCKLKHSNYIENDYVDLNIYYENKFFENNPNSYDNYFRRTTEISGELKIGWNEVESYTSILTT